MSASKGLGNGTINIAYHQELENTLTRYANGLSIIIESSEIRNTRKSEMKEKR